MKGIRKSRHTEMGGAGAPGSVASKTVRRRPSHELYSVLDICGGASTTSPVRRSIEDGTGVVPTVPNSNLGAAGFHSLVTLSSHTGSL